MLEYCAQHHVETRVPSLKNKSSDLVLHNDSTSCTKNSIKLRKIGPVATFINYKLCIEKKNSVYQIG